MGGESVLLHRPGVVAHGQSPGPMKGTAPHSTGSAAYTSSPPASLRVSVVSQGRFAPPFRPYVYRGKVSRNPEK